MARMFSRLLLACMHHRWITISVTVAAFLLALFGMKFVQQQFFPSSDRRRAGDRLEFAAERLDCRYQRADGPLRARAAAGQCSVDHWSHLCRHRRAAVRAVIRRADGEFVVRPAGGRDQGRHQGARPRQGGVRGISEEDVPRNRHLRQAARGRTAGRTSRAISRERSRHREGAGSFRKSSPASSRSSPALGNVVFDWMEPARVVKVDVLQDKARQLGVTSEDIATTLNSVLEGASITQVRDGIYLVNVMGRANAAERASIDTLRDLQLTGLARPVGAARRRSPICATSSSSRRSGGAPGFPRSP